MSFESGERQAALPPILAPTIHTLILGSFPGARSLAAAQYYANPLNQFWRLLGAAFGEPLAELPYDERLRRVLAHGIGLWDVISSCERRGSLDSNIRNAVLHDFELLDRETPRLVRVLFNGKTAGKLERAFKERGYETAVLPSSSPTYTRPFEEKLAAWRIVAERPAAGRRPAMERLC